jgi:hypothetical protein
LSYLEDIVFASMNQAQEVSVSDVWLVTWFFIPLADLQQRSIFCPRVQPGSLAEENIKGFFILRENTYGVHTMFPMHM